MLLRINEQKLKRGTLMIMGNRHQILRRQVADLLPPGSRDASCCSLALSVSFSHPSQRRPGTANAHWVECDARGWKERAGKETSSTELAELPFSETDPFANSTCSEISKDLIDDAGQRLCGIDGKRSSSMVRRVNTRKCSQNLLQFLRRHAVISRLPVLQALRKPGGINGQDEDFGKQRENSCWLEVASARSPSLSVSSNSCNLAGLHCQ